MTEELEFFGIAIESLGRVNGKYLKGPKTWAEIEERTFEVEVV